jgi:protein gp37
MDIRRQCRDCGVPFFFKQWGGVNKRRNGRKLDGRTYDEMPVNKESEAVQQSLSL